MNRHDRRRAESSRRTGYQARLIAGLRSGGKPTGIHHAIVEHDASCDVFHGRACNCAPNISISGPDGVTIIDEHGVARKVSRS